MSKSLRIDFWVILGVILFSVPVILKFQVRPMTSALLFFITPTLYLFLRKGKPIKRVLAGSVLIGILIGFVFNIILSANNAWNEVSSQLLFNYRIFGFWPVDEPIWFFFWVLFIIVFYEHFYERERGGRISRRLKYLTVPFSIILILVLWGFYLNSSFLNIRYAYFILASPSVIPIAYVIKKRPYLTPKFFKTGIFFFVLYLIYELTAVKLDQWYFPGEYVGWVNLAGIRFPLEELLFWMMLSSFTVLSLYEGFVDDDQ